MADIHCDLCDRDYASTEFSTSMQNANDLAIVLENRPQIHCLQHTSSSSFGIEDDREEESEYDDDDDDDGSTDNEESDVPEMKIDVHLRKKQAYRHMYNTFSLIGNEWGKIYRAMVIKYAFYTKSQLIQKLHDLGQSSDTLDILAERECYMNEFIDIVISLKYENVRISEDKHATSSSNKRRRSST